MGILCDGSAWKHGVHHLLPLALSKAALTGRKVTLGNKRVAAVPGRSACVHALAADVAKVSFEGASAGTASLDLKTASPDVAKGLVHKYVVMVRQNARRGT